MMRRCPDLLICVRTHRDGTTIVPQYPAGAFCCPDDAKVRRSPFIRVFDREVAAPIAEAGHVFVPWVPLADDRPPMMRCATGQGRVYELEVLILHSLGRRLREGDYAHAARHQRDDGRWSLAEPDGKVRSAWWSRHWRLVRARTCLASGDIRSTGHRGGIWRHDWTSGRFIGASGNDKNEGCNESHDDVLKHYLVLPYDWLSAAQWHQVA